jgi:NAD+--asparagine ADP-ribosyltransferase
MIAHDSIQDAYETAARERYLRNGFRHARFDAILDNKTSAICRRMNGEIVDISRQGHLSPPLHPWCRSDLIPVQDPDTAVVNETNIADEHLETAMRTKSYRPDVLNAEEVFSPSQIMAMSPTEFLEKARGV